MVPYAVTNCINPIQHPIWCRHVAHNTASPCSATMLRPEADPWQFRAWQPLIHGVLLFPNKALLEMKGPQTRHPRLPPWAPWMPARRGCGEGAHVMIDRPRQSVPPHKTHQPGPTAPTRECRHSRPE
eukprot:363318-Chlamydomonas_euryale.AAC.2